MKSDMQSPTEPSLCAVAVAAGMARTAAAATVRNAVFKVMKLLLIGKFPRAPVNAFFAARFPR
jgi:hypothetical protein